MMVVYKRSKVVMKRKRPMNAYTTMFMRQMMRVENWAGVA